MMENHIEKNMEDELETRTMYTSYWHYEAWPGTMKGEDRTPLVIEHTP